jgi:hypothetical protein
MPRYVGVALGLAVMLTAGCIATPNPASSPTVAASAALSPTPAATATLGASPAPTATTTGAPTTSSVAPTPVPSPSASPSVAATSAPTGAQESPSAHAGGYEWQRLGTADSPPDGDVIGFEGGYVAYTSATEIRFSEDGLTWERVSLPSQPSPCREDRMEVVEKMATDGESVILLGAFTTADCERLQTLAWVTRDGRHWLRSEPFGDPRYFSEAEPVDAWPVPGGWEAAIANYSRGDAGGDETALWRSRNGLDWRPIAVLPGVGSLDGEADPVGRRLLSVFGYTTTVFGAPGRQEHLWKSDDSEVWSEVETPYARDGYSAVTRRLVPPRTSGGHWIVAVEVYREDVPVDDSHVADELWASDDLSAWYRLDAPAAEVLSFSVGLIGRDCDENGGPCRLFLGADGRYWAPIAGSLADATGSRIAEGPAGVLAFAADGSVHVLRP